MFIDSAKHRHAMLLQLISTQHHNLLLLLFQTWQTSYLQDTDNGPV